MEVSAIQSQSAAATVAPIPTPEKAAEQRQLIRAVKAVNETDLFGSNRELSFLVDRETKRPVIRLVDRTTKEVIRQIPAEYVLRMAQEVKSRS
jgi:flagellar protein FlaG